MDLLESVLRSVKAERFTEKFKENGIDTPTLSLLNEEDLQILGIEDSHTRQEILKRIATLHIPKEKKNDLVIDEDYVFAVLASLNQQLLLHYASLSYAILRKDIVLCDIKMSPATRCLHETVGRLQIKVDELKQLVCPEPKKTSSKKYIAAGAIVALPLCLYFLVKYVRIKT